MQLEKSTPSMWSNAIAGMFNNWSWFTFHFYGTTFSWFLRGQNSGSQRSRLLTELFTEAGPCGRSYPAVDQCPYKRSTTLWIQILDGAAKYWQHSVLQMFLLTFSFLAFALDAWTADSKASAPGSVWPYYIIEPNFQWLGGLWLFACAWWPGTPMPNISIIQTIHWIMKHLVKDRI